MQVEVKYLIICLHRNNGEKRSKTGRVCSRICTTSTPFTETSSWIVMIPVLAAVFHLLRLGGAVISTITLASLLHTKCGEVFLQARSRDIAVPMFTEKRRTSVSVFRTFHSCRFYPHAALPKHYSTLVTSTYSISHATTPDRICFPRSTACGSTFQDQPGEWRRATDNGLPASPSLSHEATLLLQTRS
nr:uncharacterized protein LOC105874109 isoform X2 [Microcebus murinus]